MRRSLRRAAPTALALLLTFAGNMFSLLLASPVLGVPSPQTANGDLNDGAWSLAPAEAPYIGFLVSGQWSAIDTHRHRLIVMLTESWPTPRGRPLCLQLDLENLIWSEVEALGTPPEPFLPGSASAVYDPFGDRIIVFGGRMDSGLSGDTWALELSSTPQWVQLFPTGSPPAREGHAAFLDTEGERMIVFGGRSYPDLNDVWELSLSGSLAWSQLTPSGTPPPAGAYREAAVYDESRERIVVCTNPIWILALDAAPAWSSVSRDGFVPHAQYDGERDRVIGFDEAFGGTPMRCRALDLSSLEKSELNPVGQAPGFGRPVAVAFDAARDRLVHYGLITCTGLGTCWTMNDTWFWSFDVSTTATLVTQFIGERDVDGIRIFWQLADDTRFSAVWLERSTSGASDWARIDAAIDRAGDGYDALDRTARDDRAYDYRLMARERDRTIVLGAPITVARAEFALGRITPNPANGPLRVEYTLGREASVELDVFDVSGRHVRSLMRGMRSAGTHTIEWSGVGRDGPMRPGIYMVRYRFPGGETTRRLIRIR